jgi:hypothetical protein
MGRRAGADEKFLPVPLIENAALKHGYGITVDSPSSYKESDD